jgi:ABC-type uncharacterized transport system involved in gliding motility auxiliary subunit
MSHSTGSDRRLLAIAGLVLLVILLVAVNAIAGRLGRGISLDLTEQKLFTLSDGTRTVLKKIDEPITLKFYYSKKLGEAAPSFLPYVTRVRETLERYRDIAGGKIRLEIYNPEPFSNIEDQALGAGLQGVPLDRTSGEQAFFGLVATNSTDDEQVIKFFHPNREQFLEYDLTRIISRLANPKKKVVGLLTTLSMSHRPQARGMFGKPWAVLTQIGQRFDVRSVSTTATKIDPDIDVLMVVHPKGLKDPTLYAIDQYVLRGGKAIFFIDPHAETASGGRMGMMMLDTGSELPKLLDAWGVTVVKDKVVGDPSNAVRVSVASNDGRGQQIIQYLAWMGLGRANMNRHDVITGELRRINIATPGVIQLKKGSTLKETPLLFSSRQSMEIDASKLRFHPDLAKLISDFKPGGKRLVMAARFTGKVKTAFPNGAPKPEKKKGEKKESAKKSDVKPAAAKSGDKKPAAAASLKESVKPANIIIVADTDLMDDRFWIRKQNFFGQEVSVAIADNGAFVINALDNLAGDTALIGLRSRGEVGRPFTYVQRKQAQAALRLRAKEQTLVKKLKDTQKKLTSLQSKAAQKGPTILSAAQADEIEKFRGEVLQTRKELRGVQHALRSDIDQIETRLQFVMIGAVPLVIAILAIIIGFVRRFRRRRHVVAQG